MTQALVANDDVLLTREDVELLCSPNRDGRDFIQRTFDGLYFPAADHAFLDAAWSHLDDMDATRRALAISALCLAAARKQPRGVFTITTPRYDDGRRQMRMSLRELFREAAGDVNAAVFAGAGGVSSCAEVFDLDPSGIAVAYLDPPYAPPRDDTCYIKRYHFLEGLATYWRGQEIMWGTRSRKLVKRHTPFASKRTVRDALDRTFAHFDEAALVVSYGSNAALGVEELEGILRRHRPWVQRIEIPHTYAFGTHGKAQRRTATEYVLVGHRSAPKGLP
jgi:DNA adenine methylase/adenine-specific DNA-methyltransferase